MGSTLAIVIAIAAVVVGFLILKNIRSDDDNSCRDHAAAGHHRRSVAATTTLPLAARRDDHHRVHADHDRAPLVIVANSSHQNGVAKTLSTALQGQQFTMADADQRRDQGSRHQDPVQRRRSPRRKPVAQSVARCMGVASSAIEACRRRSRLSDPATLGDATVLVLLGDDKAGKTLAQMTERRHHRFHHGRRHQLYRGAVSRSNSAAAARSMHHSGSFIARSSP